MRNSYAALAVNSGGDSSHWYTKYLSPNAGLWTGSTPFKFWKVDLPVPGTFCPDSVHDPGTIYNCKCLRLGAGKIDSNLWWWLMLWRRAMQSKGLESKEDQGGLGGHRGLTDGVALEKTWSHVDKWVKIPPTHHTVTLGLQIGTRLYRKWLFG